MVPPPADDETKFVDVTPELLWVLAGEWNRQVIRYFLESDADEIAIEALAAHVAERADNHQQETLDEVTLQLHHVSLPKLVECDLIDYNSREGVIRRRENRALPADLTEHVLALDDN